MTAPIDLGAPAGEHFTYRDLVACGETYRRLSTEQGAPFDNTPRAPETFAAMRALAASVLDPVVRRFGPIEITYAFASPGLTRHIRGRIHPPIDQHAGFEKSAKGALVCPRGGLAVDFVIANLDSLALARWVVENTPFDRLYLYGPDRPIHVSHVSPPHEGQRQVVLMRRGPSGRLVPRAMSAAAFLAD